MRLFHPPLRISICYGSRDQLRPGSLLHKRKEPGNEVALAKAVKIIHNLWIILSRGMYEQGGAFYRLLNVVFSVLMEL